MSESLLVDALRQCLVEVLVVGAPVLVAAFVVGLLAGLLQAVTGIHEAAVGLLPRLVVVTLVLVAMLPWMLERLAGLVRSAVGGS